MKNSFLSMIFKFLNSYIKIKNVYGYNLAGASRRSELRKMQQVEQKESNETV